MYYLLSLKGSFIKIPFLQKGNLNPSVTLYQNLAVCYFFCQLVTLHSLYLRTASSYSLISKRLIYYFDTWAIIWHGIVSVFLKICTDLHEIFSIWTQNCFCYCFWTILVQKTITKTILRSYAANFCKSVQVFRNPETIWCQMMAKL